MKYIMSEEFINQVTLNCLMNKDQYNKYVKNNTIKLPNSVNKKDKKFYKKRIYNIIKQLLSSQETEIEPRLFTDVQKSFDNFVNICIHSLKIIDKTDIIQEDYKDISESIILITLAEIPKGTPEREHPVNPENSAILEFPCIFPPTLADPYVIPTVVILEGGISPKT